MGHYTGDAQGLNPVTDMTRVALRIDLRDYAAWATASIKPKKAKRKPDRSGREDGWPSLEEYVVDHITRHSGGHTVTVKDVSTLVSTEPVLLALDGLDEVADLEDRRRAGDQVVRTYTRLAADASNLVIVVATRPGLSTSTPWGSAAFPTFHLQRLTAGLRLQYLRR